MKPDLKLYTYHCTGCGRCTKACRRGVLQLVDNGNCRFVNIADASRCRGCGHCVRSCPHKAIALCAERTTPRNSAGGIRCTWSCNSCCPQAGLAMVVGHSARTRGLLPASRQDPDNDTGLVSEITALLADDRETPEMEYLSTLIWEELERRSTSCPKRNATSLTEIEGFSFRELVEETGIPVATLLSRKHYAVRHLRKRLADIYETLPSD